MMAQNTSDYNCDKCCCDQWHIWFVLCPPAVRGALTQKNLCCETRTVILAVPAFREKEA